jgi:D-alanyl-D-alanine carboxypeptidase (penicillin-binding protein 5/6)
MLGCMVVKSCNDLAVALARDNAGSVAAFAHQMNRRAQSLGCTNSQFSNPHGLTAAYNSSSARDMARIGMAAWRNPYIRNLASRTSFSAGGRTFLTTNDLLKTMPECQGMKTGYTRAADRCLVSVATRQGKTVLLVQLGTQTKYIWNDGRALMNWGLNS